jgi:SAM-dependent methyltransferase
VAPADRGIDVPGSDWDAVYADRGRVWGDVPSELARRAVARLRSSSSAGLGVLDLGCGYGRDSFFLAAELGCRVTGLDPSGRAIEMARAAASGRPAVEFVLGDLATWRENLGKDALRYDVVIVANLYHLLGPDERRALRADVAAVLATGGWLFLNALAVGDPQHYGRGQPVAGERESWVDRGYIHFCTRVELERDFVVAGVLSVEGLAYEEVHPDGAMHRHRAWFLESRASPSG